MDRDKLRELISHLSMLPTLPSLRDRVARILDNPQSSVRDVGALIALDPVMTARLLHSVDWRRSIFAEKVPTISKAISVLGFEALRRIIAVQEVIAPGPQTGAEAVPEEMRQLWLHSIGTAVAARVLATQIGYAEPEECYLAGLLHDIGKVVLHELFPERFYGVIAESERVRNTFYFCEVESGAASHAVYGRILVEQWDLPPALIEAVGLHHTPNLAENFTKITAVTHVADILARALALGSGGDPYVPPPKPAGLSALSLRAAKIEEAMLQIERDYVKASALLRQA